jgi:hypothetical protein
VKLPYNLNIDEEVELIVQLVFLDRYVNLPQSISLSEDQRLQYEDTKSLVSPYAVSEQKSTYKFAKVMYSATHAEISSRAVRRRVSVRSPSPKETRSRSQWHGIECLASTITRR